MSILKGTFAQEIEDYRELRKSYSRAPALRRTVDLRCRTACALADVAGSVYRLAHRVHPDVHEVDYWEAFQEGADYALRRGRFVDKAVGGRALGRMATAIREGLGLSVEEMAERCGMSVERVAHFEAGGVVTATERDAFTKAAGECMAGAR